MKVRFRSFAGAILVCVVGAVGLSARSHHHRHPPTEKSFDYYLLSLSYAPDFCSEPGGKKDPRECGSGRRVGFVVHGLWPQSEGGRGPERCGTASPVSEELIRVMLPYIPSESLIQHEWTDHGTCSGLNAADYFALIRKARDSVTIPPDLSAPAHSLQMTAEEITGDFARSNPTFPPESFQVSCYRDGELQESRICFDKQLNARACGAGARSCDAGSLRILPVR